MKKPTLREMFTIPNILSYFRILLIPLFVYLYFKAETPPEFFRAAVVLGISGFTDLFDGKIARRFNQITELGILLDPVADKLTEGAVVLCLMTRYRWVAALVVLYVLKEGFMAVAGLVMLRRGKKIGRRKMVRQGVYLCILSGDGHAHSMGEHPTDSGGYTHCRLRRGHGFYACDVYSGFREDEPGGEGGRGRKVNIPTADIQKARHSL